MNNIQKLAEIEKRWTVSYKTLEKAIMFHFNGLNSYIPDQIASNDVIVIVTEAIDCLQFGKETMEHAERDLAVLGSLVATERAAVADRADQVVPNPPNIHSCPSTSRLVPDNESNLMLANPRFERLRTS